MMTGVDPHRAGMGSNHEVAAANQKGQPGYRAYLRQDVVTIAELLRDAGYHIYMTGKWHLGKGDNNPAARGFDKSFALLNGAACHWSDQGAIIPGARTRYTRDGKLVDQLEESFYSSSWYTDQLISYIDADKGDGMGRIDASSASGTRQGYASLCGHDRLHGCLYRPPVRFFVPQRSI